MKPIELNTVEQETEAQETEYPNLKSAERALETAQAEQGKYNDAKSTLLNAQNIRKSEISRLRSELKAKAVEAAVNAKFDAFVPAFQEACARLSVISVELERLGVAEKAIEFEKMPADREVGRCMSEVAKLNRYAHSYEQGKREYDELYFGAAQAEAHRERFSSGEIPGLQRMKAVRQELGRLASFLGCEDDLASFIRDLEAEA